METVNEYGFEHLLEDGWYLTPEECYPEEVEAPEVKTLKSRP